MSDHDDFMADGADHHLATQGQLVIWLNPDDQSSGVCTAVVSPEMADPHSDDRGRTQRRVRTFSVRPADIGAQGPTLRINFKLGLNLEKWQAEAIESWSPTWVRFRCVTIFRTQQGRPLEKA